MYTIKQLILHVIIIFELQVVKALVSASHIIT